MHYPTIATKVLDFLQTAIIDKLPSLVHSLVEGDLRGVEQELLNTGAELHHRLMSVLLPAAAKAYSQGQSAAKGGKLVELPHKVRL